MSGSSNVIELQSGSLRLALRPDLGGSIAGLWQHGVPVLRSTDADTLTASRASGCFPLLPYSNRLANGQFKWLGQSYATQEKFEDSPHSIHGIGWQRAWSIQSQNESTSESEAVLSLSHAGDADWPFPFEARQRFTLTPNGLDIELSITNTAAHAVPVGLGFHPYFPKRQRSRLHVELTNRWDTDAETELPTRKVAQHGIDADVAQLSFDNCFEGWSGAARIRDESLSLKLTSSLPYLVVCTPQAQSYYCVEPVSHVSNAINGPDPVANGLRSVEPGQSTSAWMKLEIADVH